MNWWMNSWMIAYINEFDLKTAFTNTWKNDCPSSCYWFSLIESFKCFKWFAPKWVDVATADAHTISTNVEAQTLELRIVFPLSLRKIVIAQIAFWAGALIPQESVLQQNPRPATWKLQKMTNWDYHARYKCAWIGQLLCSPFRFENS